MTAMAGTDRAQVLGRLRQAENRHGKTPHPGPVKPPKRGSLSGSKRTEAFIAEAEKQFASISRLDRLDQLPDWLGSWLRKQNLPQQAVIAPMLEKLDWSASQLDFRFGPATTADAVGLSCARAAAAETGTLMMLSSAATPTTLNFVPDTEVVVLAEEDIEAGLEGCWAVLRRHRDADGEMPRAVNFVTGPSRTADIEATLVLGAHGPRRLHIVILQEQPWPADA